MTYEVIEMNLTREELATELALNHPQPAVRRCVKELLGLTDGTDDEIKTLEVDNDELLMEIRGLEDTVSEKDRLLNYIADTVDDDTITDSVARDSIRDALLRAGL